MQYSLPFRRRHHLHVVREDHAGSVWAAEGAHDEGRKNQTDPQARQSHAWQHQGHFLTPFYGICICRSIVRG